MGARYGGIRARGGGGGGGGGTEEGRPRSTAPQSRGEEAEGVRLRVDEMERGSTIDTIDMIQYVARDRCRQTEP